jgi:ketosteroid isomerase-like protein
MEMPKWSWYGLVTAETEALREAYAALNRNDIDGFVKDFDPQIERVEFEGSPTGGTYIGIEAVKAHVARGRSTWAEGACEPERFIVAGDKVVVSCHVRVRLKDQTDWLEGRTADVYTFRNGKAIEFRTFADEQQTFEYADIEAS